MNNRFRAVSIGEPDNALAGLQIAARDDLTDDQREIAFATIMGHVSEVLGLTYGKAAEMLYHAADALVPDAVA